MAKPRIPLPKQVEKVHKDESQYDRNREKRIHQQALLYADVFEMSSAQFDGLKSLASLETFVMTDQPETCRSCGARTRFRQVTDTKQFHQCTDCGKSYWLVEKE